MPAAPSRMNWNSFVQNSRTAPVGSLSEPVIVFWVLPDRLEIGAEHEGGAVDQEDMVAGLDGTRDEGHGRPGLS